MREGWLGWCRPLSPLVVCRKLEGINQLGVIAGLIGGSRVDETLVRWMTVSTEHRESDHECAWIGPDAGVGFGARQPSIFERTHSGNQPMASTDRRWVLTSNGEIHMHAEYGWSAGSFVFGPYLKVVWTLIAVQVWRGEGRAQ